MKKISLSICCILFGANLFAQILAPVKWSYAAKKLKEKKEAVLFFKATIGDGWHIYSVNQKEGGPVRTSFVFPPSTRYRLVGKITEPRPVTKFEQAFAINVNYFERSVVFRQKILLRKGGTPVKGKVHFMVCNDEKCLPPQDVEFNIPLNKL